MDQISKQTAFSGTVLQYIQCMLLLVVCCEKLVSLILYDLLLRRQLVNDGCYNWSYNVIPYSLSEKRDFFLYASLRNFSRSFLVVISKLLANVNL